MVRLMFDFVGVYYYANGDKIEGEWKDGELLHREDIIVSEHAVIKNPEVKDEDEVEDLLHIKDDKEQPEVDLKDNYKKAEEYKIEEDIEEVENIPKEDSYTMEDINKEEEDQDYSENLNEDNMKEVIDDKSMEEPIIENEVVEPVNKEEEVQSYPKDDEEQDIDKHIELQFEDAASISIPHDKYEGDLLNNKRNGKGTCALKEY